jgi:hypothetical protein
MEAVVTPRMQEIFVDYDPHRYAGMGCWPCHRKEPGGGALEFRMPNPDLLLSPEQCTGSGLTALSPRGRAAAERMHRFMVDRVAPEMARLLGRAATDYDCFECHAEDR